MVSFTGSMITYVAIPFQVYALVALAMPLFRDTDTRRWTARPLPVGDAPVHGGGKERSTP